MSDQLVRAEKLSRSYVADGSVTNAIADATFQIAPGDLIALTGPSGSGKTTLLHLIAGLDTRTSGTIEWPALGERNTLRPMKVAIAFQGPSLLPALTVAENVAFPLLLGGSTESAAQEAAGTMIGRMALDDLAGKLPEELSGGQSQRVALARALVVRPAVLLADEPTGQQDSAHAVRLLDLILALAAEQSTAVLLATHDAEIAARLPIRWALDDGGLTTRGA